MTVCPSATLVKRSPGERIAISLRCRSWLCPDCQPARRKRLISEGIRGQPDKFLTLTHRPAAGETPAAAALVLTRAWRLLRLRIMRRYRLKRLPFLAVMERHASGFPHLHILMRSNWLDQAWLSLQMDDIDGSPIVDIRPVDNKGRVAGYVAKYIGKDPARIGAAKRYWSSRDYELSPYVPRPNDLPGFAQWSIELRPINEVISEWQQLGCALTWDARSRCHATGPPGLCDRW